MSKRQKPQPLEPRPVPERPEGYRQSVNIGFDASDLENLERIREHMRRDPSIRALKGGLGRAKVTRWAIAEFAKQLPARATG